MTLRPLFIDLNLNLLFSKLTTRFSRSRSSEGSSSTYPSKEGTSHLQWPATQTRQEDGPTLGYERVDTKRGLHIVTVDQGEDSYVQV